jgi:hypothetical protein
LNLDETFFLIGRALSAHHGLNAIAPQKRSLHLAIGAQYAEHHHQHQHRGEEGEDEIKALTFSISSVGLIRLGQLRGISIPP